MQFGENSIERTEWSNFNPVRLLTIPSTCKKFIPFFEIELPQSPPEFGNKLLGNGFLLQAFLLPEFGNKLCGNEFLLPEFLLPEFFNVF